MEKLNHLIETAKLFKKHEVFIFCDDSEISELRDELNREELTLGGQGAYDNPPHVPDYIFSVNVSGVTFIFAPINKMDEMSKAITGRFTKK